MVVARGWEEKERGRSYFLMGTEVQFRKMETVLEVSQVMISQCEYT